MALGKRKEQNGQKYKVCDITGCNEMGRVIARLGSIEIAYCGHHRKKYGERIINALVNAKFNYRLSKFMSPVKHDLIINNVELCDECAKKEADYIKTKVLELEKLEKEFQENEDIINLKTQVDGTIDKIEMDGKNGA